MQYGTYFNNDKLFSHTFEIDQHNKIYKPIADLYYYVKLSSYFTRMKLINPKCKMVYMLYINLSTNLRKALANQNIIHPISNELFLEYFQNWAHITDKKNSRVLSCQDGIHTTYPYDHYSNVIKKWLRRWIDDRSKVHMVDEYNEPFPDHTLYIEI